MIRPAKDKDMARLRGLWQSAFNDTDEGARLAFTSLNKPRNILVFTDVGDAPVSMLCMRECRITSPLTSRKAAYIYGVATDAAHRGKGYVTLLLDEAHKLLKRSGHACSILVPGEKSLFDFYGKRGYETAFNINKAEINPGGVTLGEAPPLLPVNAVKYALMRDSRFSDSGMLVRWGEDYLSYILRESRLYGGGAFCLDAGEEQLCMVCYHDGETIFVKELVAPPEMLETALSAVKAHFNPQRIIIYLREDVNTSYSNNILPFGMVKWYDSSVTNETTRFGFAAPYLAHAMD